MTLLSLCLVGALLSPHSAPNGQANSGSEPKVELTGNENGFVLLKGGKPFFVKGAGAQKDLESLVAAGGNSVRTWGTDEKTGDFLDRCHQLGLTVTVGFWLNKSHEFDYGSSTNLAAQEKEIVGWVKKYKNHPAVLMWAIGNEMELGASPENSGRIWQHINRIAGAVKAEDQHRHPVISVVADMWDQKMDDILAHASNLDALGVNSYGGITTLDSRMTRWKKPYFITEFQLPNPTDGKGEPHGLPKEPSSTIKAETCETHYRAGVLSQPDRVLGSYVFYWDKSGNQTASWYNMHLKTGEALESVERMTKLWTGKPPRNRAPKITSADWTNTSGEVKVQDPDGDPVTLELEIVSEEKSRFEGDFEKDLGVEYRQKVGSKFNFPKGLKPGRYRAYILIRDGNGAAAVANHVFKVEP